MFDAIGVSPGWSCLDLVHVRFLACTGGQRKRLIVECRGHLPAPETAQMSDTVVQVRERKPI
jgi:hypothetical protein